MGGLANMIEIRVLNHVLKAEEFNIYSSIKVGLSTNPVGEDGSGLSEPVGNGYSRITHDAWTVTNRRAVNVGNIIFPEATGLWGNIGYYFLVNDIGNILIAHGALTNPNIVNSGDTVTIEDGNLNLWFYPNGSSQFISKKMLETTLLIDYYDATSDIFIGLSSADPGDDASGIVEPDSTSTSYFRVLHNNWEEVTVLDDVITSSNIGDIAFEKAGAAWGAPITHAFLADEEGNMIFYGELGTPITIQQGDTAIFRDGDITIRLE